MAVIKGTPCAVIYTRVSTGQQEEGTSLAGQFAACAKRAQEEGATLVGHFEETKSGALYESREELQKALAMIEAGEAQLLILAKLDRTGRDTDALRDIRRRVERAGAKMVFADGMTFDKGAVGDLLFTQMSAFAEFERALIRERTVAGAERLAKDKGKAPSRASRPYGYILVTKAHVIRGDYSAEQEGHYVVKPDEAKHIRLIFEMVAAGYSLYKVATHLDEQGIKPPRARKWRINSLAHIIRRDIYKGTPVWRKSKRQVDEKRAGIGLNIAYTTARPDEEHIELAPCEALVSAELWQQANTIMERGRQERSGNQERRRLLTGFVRCPLCGDRVHTRTHRNVSKAGNVQTWMYRCAGAKRGTCNLPSFGGPFLESHVIDAVQWLLNQPEAITNAQQAYLAAQQQRRAQRESNVSIKEKRKQLEKALTRERTLAEALIEARLAGRDGSAFLALQSEAESERARLERQVAELEKAEVPLDSEPLPSLGFENALHFEEVMKDDAVPSLQRALALRQLISRVYPVRWCDTGIPPEQLTKRTPKGHSTRQLAGVRVVLNRGAEVGFLAPYYVLSLVAIGRERRRDERGYWHWYAEYEKTLELLESDPFPPLPAHCAPTILDRQNL